MTHASSSANQPKTEPFPASASESETETPGGGQPQGGDSGIEGQGDTASVPAVGDKAAPATSEQHPVVQGLHVPVLDETDDRRV